MWQAPGSGSPAGVLFLDGDVAVDPMDLQKMEESVYRFPDDIHVAPAKITWLMDARRSTSITKNGSHNEHTR
jgi:hypothetical protein